VQTHHQNRKHIIYHPTTTPQHNALTINMLCFFTLAKRKRKELVMKQRRKSFLAHTQNRWQAGTQRSGGSIRGRSSKQRRIALVLVEDERMNRDYGRKWEESRFHICWNWEVMDIK